MLDEADLDCVLLLSSRLHDVVVTAIVAVCSEAYAFENVARFERWAALIERPGRSDHSRFAGAHRRLIAMRLALLGTAQDVVLTDLIAGQAQLELGEGEDSQMV